MPLFDQYLKSNYKTNNWKVFGVSAQGGYYDSDLDSLLNKAAPSERIIMANGSSISHDLTEPLQWLMQ